MTSYLSNKTILVVGASGLLGSSLVKAIISAGGNVIAADLSTKTMDLKLKGLTGSTTNITTIEVDITSTESVENLFENIGYISGAVNCTYPRNKYYGSHFFDVSLSSFNENLSLHLGSAFLFTQQCAKYFTKRNSPFSLVNVSSVYGLIPPKFEVYENTDMTMPVEYAAIKAAIQHLSKYTVKYIKDSRFRINSVCPGGILDKQPDLFLTAYREQTNGEGMLDVQDVLGCIIFLLSDDAKFITGQSIAVDDGFSL